SSSTATGTTASDTLSLHDALPIYDRWVGRTARRVLDGTGHTDPDADELAHVAPGLFEELLRGARRPAEHLERPGRDRCLGPPCRDRKSTRLNSSHVKNSYAVFCLK